MQGEVSKLERPHRLPSWWSSKRFSLFSVFVLYVLLFTTLGGESLVGSLVRFPFSLLSSRRCCCWGYAQGFVERDCGGIVLASDLDESSIAIVSGPWPRWRRTGILFPTREIASWTIRIDPAYCGCGTPSLTPEELAEVREIAIHRFYPPGTNPVVDEFRDRVAAANGTITRPLWGGYAKNVGLLAFACVVASTFGWVGETRRRARIEARPASFERGVCPNCSYDITGLSSNRCPECGDEWSEKECAILLVRSTPDAEPSSTHEPHNHKPPAGNSPTTSDA